MSSENMELERKIIEGFKKASDNFILTSAAKNESLLRNQWPMEPVGKTAQHSAAPGGGRFNIYAHEGYQRTGLFSTPP